MLRKLVLMQNTFESHPFDENIHDLYYKLRGHKPINYYFSTNSQCISKPLSISHQENSAINRHLKNFRASKENNISHFLKTFPNQSINSLMMIAIKNKDFEICKSLLKHSKYRSHIEMTQIINALSMLLKTRHYFLPLDPTFLKQIGYDRIGIFASTNLSLSEKLLSRPAILVHMSPYVISNMLSQLNSPDLDNLFIDTFFNKNTLLKDIIGIENVYAGWFSQVIDRVASNHFKIDSLIRKNPSYLKIAQDMQSTRFNTATISSRPSTRSRQMGPILTFDLFNDEEVNLASTKMATKYKP